MSTRRFSGQTALALALVLAAGCAAPVEMHADYPGYDSLDAAIAAADTIVQGEFLESREATLEPVIDTTSGDAEMNPHFGVDPEEIDTTGLGVPTTVSRIEVLETFAGTVEPGAIIEVRQMGGSGAKESSTTLLEDAGNTGFILLLAENPDGVFSLINPQAGAWTVESEGSAQSKVQSLSGQPPFEEFTTEELVEGINDQR